VFRHLATEGVSWKCKRKKEKDVDPNRVDRKPASSKRAKAKCLVYTEELTLWGEGGKKGGYSDVEKIRKV